MTTATIHHPPIEAPTSRSATRYIPMVARILLGLVFFVFGLNGFLHFIPQPPPPAPAMAFFGALFATGYMLPLIMGTQLVVGVLLLANRFVPLALILIAPVIVNIVAFHLALAPAGLPLALVVLALELTLAWSYRGAFGRVLSAKEAPMTTISPRYLDHLALRYALDALELHDPKQTQIAMTRIETRMKSYEAHTARSPQPE